MDLGPGNEHDRALLKATSTQYQWPSPRSFMSAYAQNLMSTDRQRASGPRSDAHRARAVLRATQVRGLLHSTFTGSNRAERDQPHTHRVLAIVCSSSSRVYTHATYWWIP